MLSNANVLGISGRAHASEVGGPKLTKPILVREKTCLMASTRLATSGEVEE